MKTLNKNFLGTVCATMIVTFVLFTTAYSAERPLRSSWAFPTYIDPAVGSDNSSTAAQLNLYDVLVFPDLKGDPTSHVAKKWTVSEDGLTWTFTLRSDVIFHDGTVLTAADVKFSMDRLLEIGEGFANIFTGKIDQVSAPDSNTVVFKLVEPFGPFLSTLYRLLILNEDQVVKNYKKPGPYGDKGDYGKSYLLTNDAGSGPYKVKKVKLDEKIVMELADNYWLDLDSNIPDEYVMLGTTEPVTIRTLMARRELEISDQWQAVENRKALDKLESVDIANIPQPGQFYLMIHNKKAPTDDIHVRKAMALALDYDTIAKHLFPGKALSSGPIAASIPGWDKSIFQYKRDLEKAKAELKKSKYYNELSKYPVDIHWVAEVPDREKVALLFMANMAEIGIKVNVVKVPWMSLLEECANIETSPHVTTVSEMAQYPEAGALLSTHYSSATVKSWEQNEWLMDEKFDDMLSQALKTLDRKERFSKYSELQHYIMDLTPTLFLYDEGALHAYQSGYVDWPGAKGDYIPVMGFEILGRFIKVFPEKRQDLMK